MSVENAIGQLEAQVAKLQLQKEEAEAKIATLRRNATANKTRGNINAAKQKVKMFLLLEKRVKNLNGMISNAESMLTKLLQTKVNKVSSVLARPLMKMTAENEAALEAELEAIGRNAEATPSAEHASYLRNMERGLLNAAAATERAANVVAKPTPGSPAYYNWWSKLVPRVPPRAVEVNTGVGSAPVTGPGIPVMGAPPRLGGKSRRFRTKRKASKQTKTRRVR